MSSRKWLWLGILLVVGVVAAAAMMFPRTSEQAHSGPITPAVPDKPAGVGARARIEPEDGVLLVAAPYFNGRPAIISDLRVKEGDWIRRGQLIAIVEGAGPLEKALRQSEADVEVARAKLSQVKAGSKQADIDQQKAEIARWQTEYEMMAGDLKRYELLKDNQVASIAAVDERRLYAERARRALEAAQERLKSLEAVRDEDVAVLSTQLNAALASVERAKSELERVNVRSPEAGRVLRIRAHAGEEVGPQGILELGKTDKMYVVAEVYETDISRVHVGQKAVISGELLSGKLQGTVVRIDPQVSKSELLPLEPAAFADTRVVKTRIQLDNGEPVAGLIYGKVDVVIQAQQ